MREVRIYEYNTTWRTRSANSARLASLPIAVATAPPPRGVNGAVVLVEADSRTCSSQVVPKFSGSNFPSTPRSIAQIFSTGVPAWIA